VNCVFNKKHLATFIKVCLKCPENKITKRTSVSSRWIETINSRPSNRLLHVALWHCMACHSTM